jgi:hypothetical protein
VAEAGGGEQGHECTNLRVVVGAETGEIGSPVDRCPRGSVQPTVKFQGLIAAHCRSASVYQDPLATESRSATFWRRTAGELGRASWVVPGAVIGYRLG